MGKGFKLAIVFLLALLTIALIAMVELFDVAPIGPNGTEIGFSHLNGAVRDAVGSSTTWYQITELLGVVAILTVGVFGLLGIIQWIRRKSLWKVDRKILFLGGLYIAMAVLYILFEKVVINYRPILMPGETEPEASFPPSHSSYGQRDAHASGLYQESAGPNCAAMRVRIDPGCNGCRQIDFRSALAH